MGRSLFSQIEIQPVIKPVPLFTIASLFALFAHAGRAAHAQSASSVERGVELFEQHRYSEAREALTAATRSDPNSALAAHYLGRIALHQLRFDDAITSLEQAAALEPSSSRHLLWLGRAYGQKAVRSGLGGRISLAKKTRAALEKAIALDSENIEARGALVQFYLVAPGIVGGSTRKARAHVAEIAKRSPYRGHIAKAMLDEDQNKFGAAANEYRAAIVIFPDSSAAYHGLGQLFQRSKQYDSAFTLFETMIRQRPTEMPAYYQYGRTGALSGQNPERSEEALRKYLAYEPREGEPPLSSAHYRLGLVFEKGGDRARAREQFEASLVLEPTRSEVKSALERVR